MVSGGPSVDLPVPDSGLRADVDALRLPADGLREALNVLVYDGLLRPRPAHGALDVSEPWQQFMADAASWEASSLRRTAIGPRGPFVVAAGDLMRASWDGIEWADITLPDTPTGLGFLAICRDPISYWHAAVQVGSTIEHWRVRPEWPKLGSWEYLGDWTKELATGRCELAYDYAAHRMLLSVKVSGDVKTIYCYDLETTPAYSDLGLDGVNDVAHVVYTLGYFLYAPGDGKVHRQQPPLGPWTSGNVELDTGGTEVLLAANRKTTTVAVSPGSPSSPTWVSNDNGDTWASATAIPFNVVAIACDRVSRWIAVAADGSAAMSDDLVTWTVLPTIPSAPQEVAIHRGRYFAAGLAGFYSLPYQDQAFRSGVQVDTEGEPNAIVFARERTWSLVEHNTSDPELTDLMDLGTNLTGDETAQTVFRSFERGNRTYLLGVNGVNPLVKWHPKENDGRARFCDGDPPAARSLVVAANRAMLLNLRSGPTTSPYGVDVSSSLNFDAGWGTVQTTLLGDTPGAIVAGMEIDALKVMIYKEDALYAALASVEFLGVAAPFTFEAVKLGVPGPCSPLSLVRLTNGAQAYLGNDGGVYVVDGITEPEDAGEHIRRLIEPDLDRNRLGMSWAMLDKERRLLWFFYPSVTYGMRAALLLDVRSWPWKAWPVRLPSGFNATAGLDCDVRTGTTIGELTMSLSEIPSIGSLSTYDQQSYVGTDDGQLFLQQWADGGTYQDGDDAIPVVWWPGWSSFAGPAAFATLHDVHNLFPTVQSGESFNVTAYAQNHQMAQSSQGPKTVTAGTTNRRASFRLTGIRHSLRYSASITRLFQWAGARAWYRQRGMSRGVS